jgi:cyclic beta-1,2-glucan synthetase
VYDIALETIAHGDGRVDIDSLSGFVAAYQGISPMRLGELWAIPIMLRLAVIENLRRVGVRIAASWAERNLAATWAERMAETAVSDPKSLILVIAEMASSDPPMVGGFVAELARRLQGRGPTLALPLTWIEQRLSESGLTIEHLVQAENQQQAADQVSISNSIGSLRVLGATDWRTFVETQSVVENTLREDPGGAYGRMDFATRDRYRHAIERIAKKACLSEGEVARKAVELARMGAVAIAAGGGAGDSHRAGHVGYYLIDKGLPQLERAAQVRRSGAEALRKTAARFPSLVYLGGIALITVIVGASLLAQAFAAGAPGWLLVPIGIVSLLAASQLGVALVNWLATLLVAPHPLPRMDFSEGIPADARTLVVVPTMLTSASGVEDLVEALEVRFLANRDERLHFGLLTDFRDARQESLPEDDALVILAGTRIGELNAKYGGDGTRIRGDLFFLFHRPRRWNPEDRLWMGYERKRGKLAELNALLRGGTGNGFALVVGDRALLSSVKYVLTLDTDTQLPRDAARQFVGTMAHPLNRPAYDAAKRRVTAGYGILQPRVAIGLPATNRSRYARLYGGEPGIDPYTRAVSDVYQDVFGEGSFIGKGIYDVDAFEQALGGRFPENRVLSHDLLEGCYARAGLLSDVHLYEDYPIRYSADVSRRYRWIRGDWQLAGWLRRRVPGATVGADNRRQKNPLSMLSQWKLFDNLRRSLVPAALTLLLLSGWTLLAPAWLWTLAAIAIMLLPPLCATLLDVFRKPEEALLRQHLASITRSAYRHFMQLLFELACLPYEAFFSLQAITRTAWRMLVTRSRLLEWNPSGEADREAGERDRGTLAACFRTMWFAPAMAAVTTMYLAASSPAVLAVAGPILLLWSASPLIAWWISRPLAPRKASLSGEQTLFLRALSRRTWAFFDRFVGPDEHWLPPDNVQEYRVAAVAHRTSPTNIGLALLANLSAYDFGYLVAGKVLERAANTLNTMDAWSGSAATSTTGTTRRPSRRCRRCTSRRWTAGTCRPTC